MSVTTYNNLTREHSKIYHERREPQARNPIYQKKVNIGCRYCKRDKTRGRVKNYDRLWCLYMHFKVHHPMENFKDDIQSLADLIIQGVLI